MKKRKKWLNDNGNTTPLTISLILVLLLIICMIAEIFRLSLIVKGVRDGLQQATIAVATENWDELYNGLREGYSGGYILFDEEWEESLDDDDIYLQLDKVLGTKESGEKHIKGKGETYEYALSDLQTELCNSPFQSAKTEENMEVKARIKIEIPFSFGFQKLPSFEMIITTKAVYMPKF